MPTTVNGCVWMEIVEPTIEGSPENSVCQAR